MVGLATEGSHDEEALDGAHAHTRVGGGVEEKVKQFAHHGSDHRAHVGTILGANGLEAPDLDVWAYGREIGAVRALPRA